MGNIQKTKTCKRCGGEFYGWANQEYCKECKHSRRLETERARMSRLKGRPVTEGKWRCPICGCFKDKHAKVCASCHNKQKVGENSPSWRGGTTRSMGYVFIRAGAGKDARYIQEHRLVWEQAHGAISEGHVIHHLNGIKDDNRLENLVCFPRGAHSGAAIHRAYKARIRDLESQLDKLRKKEE